MNIFRKNMAGISANLKKAALQGFSALPLDGFDFNTAIRGEKNEKLLLRALSITETFDERIWIEKLSRQLHAINPNLDNKLKFAAALVRGDDLTGCEKLLAQIDQVHMDLPLFRETLAVLRAKQGDTEEAISLFDKLPGNEQGSHPAPIVLPTATDMLSSGDSKHSLALIGKLHSRYPNHLYVRSLQVKCHLISGEIEKATALTEIPFDLSPDAMRYDRRAMVEAKTAILGQLGWLHELFEFLRDAIASDPVHWNLYSMASEIAKTAAREEEYSALLNAIPPTQSKSPEAMALWCYWHIHKHRVNEANSLLKKIRPLSTAMYLHAQFSLRINHGQPQEIEQTYENIVACGLPILGPTIGLGMYLYYFNSSAENLDRSRALLDSNKNQARNDTTFWQIFFRILIASGRHEEAAEHFSKLPAGLQKSSNLRQFSQYFQALNGNHDDAKRGWVETIRETRHLCVNARSSYPRTVKLRYMEKPNGILLFACVFNGIDYIDWFLNHYRKLGVDHFFIVDNGSADGTLEKLLLENDVSVFSNTDSFGGSGFGILWINHLLKKYGENHWCFNVDIDEGFVFPGQEKGRSLKNLLSYCERNNYAAVRSFCLDMYPEKIENEKLTDRFAESCYFDTDYTSVAQDLPPYVFVQGGIRKRMTGLAIALQKVPLIFMEQGVSFIECNHHTTHLPFADISTALLHYKLVGDTKKILAEAIDRDEYFAGAKFYRRMNDAFNTMGWSETLLSSYSRRYRNTSDLIDAGLITGSPKWDIFQTPNKNRK